MEKHVREDIVDRLVFDRDPFGASYSAFDTRHGYPSPQLVLSYSVSFSLLLSYSVREEALSKLLPFRCNLIEVGVRLASLDGYGLREIPGVVRVVSLLHGRPVRHQLKRYRLQDRCDTLLRFRYLDEVRVDLARFIRDPDHPRSPRLKLLRVREGIGVRLPTRVDDDDRRPVLYQGQRSVLQLARGHPLGVYVGELLHLQGALKGHWVVVPPPDEVEVGPLPVHPRDFFHCRFTGEGLLDHPSNLFSSSIPAADKVVDDQVCDDDLCREALRRSHSHLRSAVQEQGEVALPGKRRPSGVYEGKDLRSLLLCLPYRFEEVGRLPALRECDHDRAAVDEL